MGLIDTEEQLTEGLKRRLATLEVRNPEGPELPRIIKDYEPNGSHFRDFDVFRTIIRICVNKYGIRKEDLADLWGTTPLVIEGYIQGRYSPHALARPPFIQSLMVRFDEFVKKGFVPQ